MKNKVNTSLNIKKKSNLSWSSIVNDLSATVMPSRLEEIPPLAVEYVP